MGGEGREKMTSRRVGSLEPSSWTSRRLELDVSSSLPALPPPIRISDITRHHPTTSLVALPLRDTFPAHAPSSYRYHPRDPNTSRQPKRSWMMECMARFSSAAIAFPSERMAASRSNFFSAMPTMRSSTVSAVTRRYTVTGRV